MTLLASTPLYQGRVLDLRQEEHRLPDGRIAPFEIIRHPGGAAVLPLLDDDRVLLLRQYRPAAGGWVIEIPGGRLEVGEEPALCAARELREETGYTPRNVTPLGSTWSAIGYGDEQIHLFVAADLEAGAAERDADEQIELFTPTLAEALALVADGTIRDAKTQLALLLYARRAGEIP